MSARIAREAAREHEADARRIAHDAERLAATGKPEAAAALRELADLTAGQARGLRERPPTRGA